MSYDIDPERRETLLESAALGGAEPVQNFDLRPITSATWSLLVRLENPFLTGKQDGDYSFAVWSFVYLHSRPIEQIRKRISQLDDLRADIYAFMDGQQPASMFAFLPWITSQVEQVAATITQQSGGVSADPKV